MKIAVFQFSPIVGALTYNTDKLLSAINKAQANGCDLFICPELSLSGYPPEDLLLRDDCVLQIEQLLEKFLALRDITIILPLPWYLAHKIYNSVFVIHNGQIITRYTKANLPNYGVFDDKRYFSVLPATHTTATLTSAKEYDTSGIFTCAGHKLGVIICEDVWNTAPAYLRNVDIDLLCVVNASPYEEHKHNHRLLAAKARASEVNAAILYVNCVGGQDELVYDGASFLIQKSGEVSYQAVAFSETLDYIHYDNTLLTKIEPIHNYPQLIAANYAALVMAIRDYVTRNNFKQVVIGLSGGVDSALVLALAVDALGADNVIALMLPTIYTSEMSLEDAREIAKRLGIRQYQQIDIMSLVDCFNQALAPIFTGLASDTTEENLQARIRGTLLMAIANKFNALLLATGNKSEMATGYATLYGDMAGGFAPLKDVLKTMVYELCNWRNRETEVIPARIITRAPSAELKANQTDQDSLPEYAVLDQIIIALVHENHSTAELIASGKFDKDTVRKVARLIKISEHKRQQSAPGPKITKRAFSKEWRYPITSGYEF